MFTGLIEQQGRVLEVGRRLVIEATFDAIQPGESIAVNGVCLTVLPEQGARLAFDVSPETLKLTTLSHLMKGESVNLERALLVNARMGGHYVSGHVDTTAVIKSMHTEGNFTSLIIGDFGIPAESFIWPKGSITLDGVSLTINAVEASDLTVMLVPHTQVMTTLGQRQVGGRVNVEFDYLARAIAHQLDVMRRHVRLPEGLL